MGPGYSLNPGRYVGVAEKEEVDFDFSEKLHALNEELERLINSLLFERLALSKDREKVLEFYNYVLKCFCAY